MNPVGRRRSMTVLLVYTGALPVVADFSSPRLKNDFCAVPFLIAGEERRLGVFHNGYERGKTAVERYMIKSSNLGV